MADWTDLLQRPGQSDGVAEFALNARQAADQHSQSQLQDQLVQAQTANARQKAALNAQYQTDVAAYLAKPDVNTLSNLQAKYPEQAEALSKAWSTKDAAQKTADQGYLGSVYSALSNNRSDLALNLMRQRRDADQASGLDITDDNAQIAAIEKGDAGAINTVKGMFLAHLAAADPDKFASTFGAVSKPNDLKNVGPGSSLVDPNTGKAVYTAPFAPQYKTVGPDSTLVQVGGGGQASGAGGGSSAPLVSNGVQYAPAGKTKFGWTPWQGNGGDNSTEAYVGKINGMTKALGVGPNDDISKLPPKQIYEALTLSEGGKAGNRGNLRNPDGSFKNYGSQAAGDNAGIAQVVRNLKRGQTTIATMVGGLPDDSAPAAAGGAKVLYAGAGNAADPTAYKPGTAVAGMSADAIDRAAQSYNLTGKLPVGLGRKGDVQRAILSRAAQFASGVSVGDNLADQAGRAADVGALKKLEGNSANILSFERTALRNGALAARLSGRVDNGGVPIFNSWVNAGRRATGDPAISSFDAAVETFANEYAKVTTSATGGGVTSDSAREHARSLINTAQSPDQFLGVLQTLAEDMRNRKRGLETQRQEILNRIKGGGSPQGASEVGSQQNPIPVRSAQEAKKYSGKWVKTPDGRIGRAR